MKIDRDADLLLREHLTDLGNARRFVIRHGQDVRFNAATQSFLEWDGRRFKPDMTQGVMRRAKETVLAIYPELAHVADDDLRRSLAHHARRSESAQRLEAMIKLAGSEFEIIVDGAQLDSHPHLLNVLNGTMNLDSFELQPHNRADLLTQLAPVEWTRDARSDLFEHTLERAIPNPATRRHVQKLAGYTLHGRKTRDVFALLYGPTRTMKGTFLGAVAGTLGEFAIVIELDALAERDHAHGPRPDLVRLKGKRMAIVHETARALRLDAALVKSISGSDPITARGLYSSPITFLPGFMIWIGSNHRPRIPHDDDAVFERLHEVPFVVQLAEHERDPNVRAELSDPSKHGAAILAWAVEGLRMLNAEGLEIPEDVRSATNENRAEQDPLREFLDITCVFEASALSVTSELLEAQKRWAEHAGERPASGKVLGQSLRARGCKPTKVRGERGWLGVGLADRRTA